MDDQSTQMYRDGAITRYQLMIDCLHMADPHEPQQVLQSLPPEVLDELLEYAGRYDPRKPAPESRLMPTVDQVDAAVRWATRARRSRSA